RKTMILARQDFEHEGRLYSAELRIVGFPLSAGRGESMRWVVFNDALTQHWTLPGEGMLSDSAADVKLRFGDHLARSA
ncbi:MAG: hypothetical protein ABI679_13480, partial [Gemmatimonadota bacterium]